MKKWIFAFFLISFATSGSSLSSSEIRYPQQQRENPKPMQVNDEENIRIIEAFLNRTVPGLTVSYREVFDELIDKGHEVNLIGGTLRDLLLDDPANPSDIDFTYSGSAEELEAILIKHQWLYTRLPNSAVFEIGSMDGQFLQGVPISYCDIDDPNQQEFTVNHLVYNLKDHMFLERSQAGFVDLKQKQMRIVSQDWKKWLMGNPKKNRRDKIFRFWRMVAKGYSYSLELEKFIKEETYALQKNDQGFLISEMIRYFGGHMDSYEEALMGCKMVMGREWSEKYFQNFYSEFLYQNQMKKIQFAQHTHYTKKYVAKTVQSEAVIQHP